jgi:transposase InsO family protein
MSWKEVSVMSQRLEFVTLATAENANLRHLCRCFGISPNTAYKWLDRFQTDGLNGLEDRSRRPNNSPVHTAKDMEDAVIDLRGRHPAWGGRKLERRLLDIGHTEVPRPSTITAILKRHNLIDPKESAKHQAFCRFERAEPNELWQMDFKGEFKLPQGRCYPLTILDDHSRYAIALEACDRNNKINTQAAMIKVFRLYGLPEWITCDNGSPWGSGGQSYYTALGVWLLRLGVGMSHSRPHHPQTQGKDERFHRTLKAEVLQYRHGTTLADWQLHFDEWRVIYNTVRPHEALSMKVPASRYQPSLRRYPEQLPAIEYGTSDIVRKVRRYGHIKYAGREYHVGSAFYGLHVALRPTTTDGLFDVFFCQHKIGSLDLADNKLS